MKNKITKPALSFEQAIGVYKNAEKTVAVNFINGVIYLGKILKEQKDIWIPEKKWERYLEEVGKSLAGANQFIRLYEYSEKHIEELMDAQLTNWARLNSFLALPEPLRQQLAQELNDGDIDNDAFAKKVQEIQPSIDLDNEPDEFTGLVNQAININLEENPDTFLEQIKQNNENITDKSSEVAKSLLYMGMALKGLREKKTFQKLSEEERIFWNDILKKSIKELKLISKILYERE